MIKRFQLLISLFFCCSLMAQEMEAEKPKDTAEKEKPNSDKVDVPVKAEKQTKKLKKELILENRDTIFRIPGSGTLIEKELLEKFEYDDIHRVLVHAPGVYFREEDGYGLRPNIGIRGANSDRSSKVTLMEDDVLLGPAPYSAPAAYYFPLVTRMTNVSVIKGPAGVQYGPNTIGGAVQLQTREIPKKSLGQIDVSGGTDQFLKGHTYYGNTKDIFGFLGEFVHESTDGFKELDGGGNTGFLKNEAMVKMGLTFDKDADAFHQIELKLGYSDETSDETYLGLADTDFAKNPYRRYVASELDEMEWDRTQVVAKYILGFGDSVIIKNNIYRHGFSRQWNKFNRFKNGPDISDILENHDSGQEAVYFAILNGSQNSSNDNEKLMIGLNDRKFISQGIQSDLEWEPEAGVCKQRISFGLRLHYDKVERDHTETAYLMQNKHLVSDGSAAIQTTLEEAKSLAIATYLKYEVEYKKLKLTPGFRFEKIYSELKDSLNDELIDGDQFAFIPGCGVFYGISDSLGLLGGIHKGFSPIAPGQKEGIDQEESVNYELGLRFQNKNLFIECIGFFNSYSNLTSIGSFSSGANEAELNEQFNAGKVYIYGVELVIKNEFLFRNSLKMPVSLVYSYTASEFQRDFSSDDPQYGNVQKGDSLPYVPKSQLNFTLGVEYKKWGISMNFKYLDAMKELAGTGSALEGKETDAYFLTDFATFYKFNEKHQIYGKVDNAFNEEYIVSRRPFGARPGMPLHATLGYKFSF